MTGSGITTLNGPITGVGNLKSNGGGSTIVNTTTITTLASQTYTDPITLGASSVLTGTNLTLASLNGAGFNLTLTGSGLTTLGGPISGVNTLLDNGSGTTKITGGSVTTIGDQTYSNPMTLGASTLLTGGNLNLVAVTGAGFDLTLHGSLLTTLGGPIGGVGTLSSNNGGTTIVAGTINAAAVKMIDPVTFNVGSVTTTGDQTYSGTITLATNTVLTGVNLTLAAVVGAGFNLTLHGSAVTTLGGPITGVGALTSDGGGTTIVNSTISVTTLTMIDPVTLAGGSITTTGDQTYSGTITLGANTVLAGVNLTLAGVVGAGFDLTLDASGLTTLGGAISGIHMLTSNSGGTTTVAGTISATTVNMVDPVTLDGGSVTTTGTQTYTGAVTIAANTTLTGATITFASTADDSASGTHTLAIVGNAFLGGKVGGLHPLKSLSASGNTTLAGNSVTTTGDQLYSNTITLGTDNVLTGANLTLAAVNGAAFNLTLSGSLITTLQGAVTVGTLTSNGGGSTVINGGSVTTLGAQTYADAVVIGVEPTTLTGTQISFASTLDAAATGGQSLTINGGRRVQRPGWRYSSTESTNRQRLVADRHGQRDDRRSARPTAGRSRWPPIRRSAEPPSPSSPRSTIP